MDSTFKSILELWIACLVGTHCIFIPKSWVISYLQALDLYQIYSTQIEKSKKTEVKVFLYIIVGMTKHYNALKFKLKLSSNDNVNVFWDL